MRVKNTEQLAIRRSYDQEVSDVIEVFIEAISEYCAFRDSRTCDVLKDNANKNL